MRDIKRSLGLLLTIAVLLAVAVAAPPLAALGVVVGDTSMTSDDALTAAMKVMFEDTIVNNVVVDSELLDLFEEGDGIKTDQTTGGRYIETAQLFSLPAGVGARSEGGYIPVPKGPRIANGKVTLKNIYGSVEMTGEVLKRVKGDRGAFLNWGEQAMPKLVERLTNEMDRMTIGYGSGIKARVNAAVPATDLIVDSALGVTGYTNALLQFLPGETLRASANADGSVAHADVYTVTDIDFAGGHLIVDKVTNLADNDYLFEGDAADIAAGKEFMGLLGIVDDGGILNSFQNIHRDDYMAWKSLVVDVQTTFGAGTKLTEDVVLYADRVANQRGGAKIDTFVTSGLGLEQLWKDLKGDRTFNDPRSFTGGRGGIFIILGDRVIPIRVARKLPDALAFGLTKSSLRKWMLHAFEWDTTTGALFRQVTDATGRKNAFYAYGTMCVECGSSDPQKNFRVENFATP